MPEIQFFEEMRPHRDYSMQGKARRYITMGAWRFYLTGVRSVCGLLPSGIYDVIGYEVTYSNSCISQEETDRLMQRFREETGQG